MPEALISDLKRRMDSALDVLKKEFAGLRTGRASINLLDPVVVDAYGSMMPINQVGSVNTPEPRMLTVQVWDKGLVKNVEKAIREAGLGLNPQADGQLIRIPLPDLSEERRKEIARVAAKYAEQAKIAIRNVRRDGMEALKGKEKAKQISEDDLHRLSEDVQKLTDDYVKNIDTLLAGKEKEVMQV